MNEFRETDSGLVVPVEPVSPSPKKQYSLMELQDENSREKAKDILCELAKVMDLIHGTDGYPRICEPTGVPAIRRRAYGAIHYHLGELLLGEDNPGWEEYT